MIIKCAADGCGNYITITEATRDKAGDEPDLVAAQYNWSIYSTLQGEKKYLCGQHTAERIEHIWKGHKGGKR